MTPPIDDGVRLNTGISPSNDEGRTYYLRADFEAGKDQSVSVAALIKCRSGAPASVRNRTKRHSFPGSETPDEVLAKLRQLQPLMAKLNLDHFDPDAVEKRFLHDLTTIDAFGARDRRIRMRQLLAEYEQLPKPVQARVATGLDLARQRVREADAASWTSAADRLEHQPDKTAAFLDLLDQYEALGITQPEGIGPPSRSKALDTLVDLHEKLSPEAQAQTEVPLADLIERQRPAVLQRTGGVTQRTVEIQGSKNIAFLAKVRSRAFFSKHPRWGSVDRNFALPLNDWRLDSNYFVPEPARRVDRKAEPVHEPVSKAEWDNIQTALNDYQALSEDGKRAYARQAFGPVED